MEKFSYNAIVAVSRLTYLLMLLSLACSVAGGTNPNKKYSSFFIQMQWANCGDNCAHKVMQCTAELKPTANRKSSAAEVLKEALLLCLTKAGAKLPLNPAIITLVNDVELGVKAYLVLINGESHFPTMTESKPLTKELKLEEVINRSKVTIMPLNKVEGHVQHAIFTGSFEVHQQPQNIVTIAKDWLESWKTRWYESGQVARVYEGNGPQ